MIVAQRRKDKDIGHLPPKRDKSKLRDDRKKPSGLPKSDPDSKDIVKDPDLKIGEIKMMNSRIVVARRLVRMAKAIIAYEVALKKYEKKGNAIVVNLIWNDGKNYFCDVLAGYDFAADVVERLDKELKEVGVTRIPDHGGDTYVMDEDSLSVQYDVSNATGDWEAVLRKEGFKK